MKETGRKTGSLVTRTYLYQLGTGEVQLVGTMQMSKKTHTMPVTHKGHYPLLYPSS